MIEAHTEPSGGYVGQIVIRPNQSFTWRASKIFLGLLLALSLSIGISFFLQGYWMILPFSILEVSVVATCFFLILRRAQHQQVIAISTEHIRVEEGFKQPERIVDWQRYFTKVVIEKPRYQWYNIAIKLRHRDEEIELGRFLNASEKEELVEKLRSLIHLANHRQIEA